MTAAQWRWRVAGICAVAFAARVAQLGGQSLWYDEAFSLLVAHRAPAEIVAATARDNHPPLFYLLQWWWQAAGSGEFVWRFPWAAAGTLTVALTAALGRRTVGTRPALFGALLAALAPFLVLYSQEVRMYALLCLAATLACYAWLRQRSEGGIGWAAASWLGLVGALYTHVFGALTALALASTLALPGKRRPALLTLAATALAWLPWAAVLPQQAARVRSSFWYDAPTVLTPIKSLVILVYGGVLPLTFTAAALFLVLLIPALALPSVRKRPPGAGVVALAALLLVPMTAALAASLVRPVYLERTLIAGVPAWCLLLGWSLTRLPDRRLAIALGAGLLVLAAAGLGRWYLDPTAGKPPYRWAAAQVRDSWRDGDAIVHTADSSLLPLLVYLPGYPQALLDGNPAITPESVRGWALYSTLPFPPTPPQEAGRGARRVWLIVAPDYNAEWQYQAAADYRRDRTLLGEWRDGGLTVLLLAAASTPGPR